MLFQILFLGLLKRQVTRHSFLPNLCLTNETELAKLETMGFKLDECIEEQQPYARADAKGT
jgi:hypothetical protein